MSNLETMNDREKIQTADPTLYTVIPESKETQLQKLIMTGLTLFIICLIFILFLHHNNKQYCINVKFQEPSDIIEVFNV